MNELREESKKMFTNSEQTAKLIELGFVPKMRIKGVCTKYGAVNIEHEAYFGVGELMEMLEEVASVVISYSYQKNGYYVRVIIPKRDGGGMYRISRVELVDALYDMIVKLKEEGVI